MKTMTKQILGAILAVATSLLLASCTIDGMDFHDTGSGEMFSGGAFVESCHVVAAGTKIDTVVGRGPVSGVPNTRAPP